MNLSFLRYFKKDRAPAGAIALACPPPAIEKPASERFGKTVLPNSSRVVGLEPSRTFPIQAPLSGPTAAAHRKISLGGSSGVAVAPITPGGDRTIALNMVDLAGQIPAGKLKPTPIDPQRRVVLKASEVERGMATGRPTVLLHAIYQQAPELFAGEVTAADQTEVALPMARVLEQFAAFQVRDDQVCDQAPPQVETPFLKVTIEDSERFGTSAAPLKPNDKPAVKAASAGTTAAAPPEAVAATKPPPSVRLPAPIESKGTAEGSPAKAPIRLGHLPAASPISPTISPNGTGVPATERVPASSGSPVPTPLPAVPAPIPFKVSPPSDDLRPPALRPARAAKTPEEAIELSTTGPRVQLPLRSILRGISPVQLTGSVEDVPEGAKIELPFSIIQPQLSLGRIAISPAQFQAAMPEEYRKLFKCEEAGMPIPLALPEVLQHVPNELLQLRGDQEEVEVLEAIETPFSQKMAEDAARMKVPAGPVAKPEISPGAPELKPKAPEPAAQAAPASVAPPVAPPAVPVKAAAKGDKSGGAQPQEIAGKAKAVSPKSRTPATAESKPAAETAKDAPESDAPAGRTALQIAFDTDETLTAKSVVGHASRLPGLVGCGIVFSDGLSLAGNIPTEFEIEALCALAPAILRRLDDQMAGTNLGALSGITLFCAKAPVSFFAHGNICLAAIHSAGELPAETRDRLGRVTQELARMYAESKPND